MLDHGHDIHRRAIAARQADIGGACRYTLDHHRDEANAKLVDRVNADGTIYLTHTKLDDVFTIRLAVGQRATQREHVVTAWETLRKMAG